MRHTSLREFIVLTMTACTLGAHAQTQMKFSEGFENVGTVQAGQQGPENLIQSGWIFRNQSSEITSFPAWSGNGGTGWPNSGSGFLRGSSSSTGLFGASLSVWAVLPPVMGQAAGDTFSVWVLDGGKGETPTYLDIRYSPSGGTSTGSGPSGVGDFTEVLFSGELPISSGPVIYTLASAVLPGTGRIAIRFHAPAISNFQSSANVYLDDVSIGAPAGPPCGLTIPAAGQTVTWNANGSPYLICQDIVIPKTAKLVLEPGVRLEFTHARDIIVEGDLIAQGTAASPVEFAGDNVTGLSVYGRAELHYAEIDASVSLYTDSAVEAFDSNFLEQATLASFQPRTFVRLERCEMRGGGGTLGRTTVIDDTTITNPQTYVSLNGFWRIEGLDSAAPLTFIASMQDRTIDNVTVTGVVNAPAMELHATASIVDFHLGAGNVLEGNLYPVWPRFTGLTPDSKVPTSGNINNAILGPEVGYAPMRSRVSIPDFGVPYHFLDRGRLHGDVRIDPGTVLKFGPLGGLTISGDKGTDGTLRGIPGKPIVLERLNPSQEWFSLATGPGWQVFEHLDISGAGVGVVGNEAELWLRDSVIHNCAIGAYPAADGNIYGSGIEFYNNQLALRDDPVNPAAQIKSGVHFSGVERANIFEGNVLAAKNFGTTNGTLHLFRADNNWWGHETGPYEPNFHPQGQGDEVSFGVDFQPFLTQKPGLTDARPVVRLKTRVHPVVLPGEKFFIEWEAFDDGTITSFDVVMLDPDYNLPPGFHFLTLGANLPGSQRSFEIQVPEVGLHPYERFPFRIIATDDAGNTSFEQFWVIIPHEKPSGTVVFHTPLVEFRGGEDVTICYDALGLNTSPRFYIETAADDRMAMSAAGNGGTNACSFSPVRMPYASSDRVRLAIRAEGNWNRDEWYFTDYFTIRPDPRIGDAPPQVQVLSPTHGQTFMGGEVIPITWTASDDKGLREFRIQASFNGGYTFHTIATEVPGSATAYDWRLPASTGIDDVRVRVVAVDTMMQNSSSGDDRIIQVLPGAGCYADCDGSGFLDLFDFLCFTNAFNGADPYADCDGSGMLDLFDFLCFTNAFNAGCP